MALIRKYLYCAAAMVLNCIVACGDNITENTTVVQNDIGVFENAGAFPSCTADNSGKEAYAKDDSRTYVCASEKWHAVSQDAVGGYSCYAVPSEKSVEVFCNGTSIGVFENGNDGIDGLTGKKGGRGDDCEVAESLDSMLVIACGKEKVSLDLRLLYPSSSSVENIVSSCSIDESSSSEELVSSSSEESSSSDNFESSSSVEEIESSSSIDEEAMPISLDTLSGYSQKGPFIVGSTVRLYELQDGRTLKQTNGNFYGTIDSANGRFKFRARDLVSQYVMLQAEGYYRNEVTGKVSDAKLTLRAITDVSSRTTANVNLLTHLEYDRVHYLVTRGKMKVKAAKRQARAEIFTAFYMDTTGIANSEDLNVFGEGAGSASLLAISVLLQGDRSIAKLTDLLAQISADIEADGKWDDSTTRALVADGAELIDMENRLPVVQQNVENWNLGAVPDFIGLVRNYWWTEYGIPACNEENEGLQNVQATNKYASGSTKKYACAGGQYYETFSKNELLGHFCANEGEQTLVKGYYKCVDSRWVLETEKFNSGTIEDVRDGKVYKTIGIGTQMWMAENLQYEYKVWNEAKNDSVVYGYSEYNDGDYSWVAAMDSAGVFSDNGKGCGEDHCFAEYPVRGVCPEGWHLPDTTEWKTLYKTVGESAHALQKYDSYFFPDGTDLYGFSAYIHPYWTSNRDDVSHDAYSWHFDKDRAYVRNDRWSGNIRCIQDDSVEP